MLALNNSLSADLFTVYKPERSISFDGISDHIKIPAFSSTNHTIHGWIKKNDTSGNKTVIDFRDDTGDGIMIFFLGNEKMRYLVNDATLQTSSAIASSTWIHIGCTYDGSTQKIYLNGELIASQSTSQTINTTNLGMIGGRAFSTFANGFSGNILQLTGFTRALAEEEIAAIYNNGVPLNPTLPIVGYATTNIAFSYLFGDCGLDTFPILGDALNTSKGAELLSSTYDTNPNDDDNWIFGFYPATDVHENTALTYNSTEKQVEINVSYPASNTETQHYQSIQVNAGNVVLHAGDFKTEVSGFAKLHGNVGDSFTGSSPCPADGQFHRLQHIGFTDSNSQSGYDVYRFQGAVSSSIIGNTFSYQYTVKNPSVKILGGKAGLLKNMTEANITTDTP